LAAIEQGARGDRDTVEDRDQVDRYSVDCRACLDPGTHAVADRDDSAGTDRDRDLDNDTTVIDSGAGHEAHDATVGDGDADGGSFVSFVDPDVAADGDPDRVAIGLPGSARVSDGASAQVIGQSFGTL
jgi:hypothetical protein